MHQKIARARWLEYRVEMSAPARRLARVVRRLALAMGVLGMLALTPMHTADAKRQRVRVRWPSSLQAPSLTWWMRAFFWDLMDVGGLSRLFVEGTPMVAIGQSIGKPYRGALVGAIELPDDLGYHRRHPKRVYATSSTVHHLRSVIGAVREAYPRLHRLSVGDLSSRHGGKLTGHRSHQSGRDVDLGFYFRNRPWIYPYKFASPSGSNLHFRATWALIEALVDTVEEPDGVDYILLDYRVQRMLYVWALRQGVPRAKLDRILQYPRGRRAEVGIVRHYPKHANHMHVRFKCPPQDVLCI